VSLRQEDVHSLVLWSKDYAPVLGNPDLLALLRRYSVYCHFTLTGLGGSSIEPRVPDPAAALDQLAGLVTTWGAARLNWRFDPILHWADGEGKLRSNADSFDGLAASVAETGVTTCTFSFCFWYGKCIARARKYGLRYVDPAEEQKLEILTRMARRAASLAMTLSSCAADRWAAVPGIQKGRCVDGELLTRLHPTGEQAAVGKDKSQRAECGCTPSVDIGSYSMRCNHGCLYCYANPVV
jgi:DNA repair photolyase